MVHQLITIAETIGPDDSVWSVFDRKLEAALPAVDVAVSVRLRSELGHGIELVRWIEGWSLRFKQQQKTLLCIAEDPRQRECLDLSHPNMELVYISSLNEIPKILLHLTRQKVKIDTEPVPPEARKNVIPEKKEEEQTGSVPPSDYAIEKGEKESDILPKTARVTMSTAVPVSSDDLIGYRNIPYIHQQVKRNTVIEVSGEYQCDHCGNIRMFCKGDVVDTCENRECSSLDASFTLQFDLF